MNDAVALGEKKNKIVDKIRKKAIFPIISETGNKNLSKISFDSCIFERLSEFLNCIKSLLDAWKKRFINRFWIIFEIFIMIKNCIMLNIFIKKFENIFKIIVNNAKAKMKSS